jgi:hypothetical protein
MIQDSKISDFNPPHLYPLPPGERGDRKAEFIADSHDFLFDTAFILIYD